MRPLICVIILLALPLTASADERITDNTAYTIPEGNVRAGLWKLQYGVHRVPGLEIGTYTLPYLSWAADVRSVNVHAKYQFLDRNIWTLAGSLGVAYVDFGGLGVDAKITIVPVTLLASARLSKRFTLGTGVMYTQLYGESSYNEDEASELRGAVAANNVQGWLSLMMKISTGWTLYLESRGISSTEGAAAADAHYQVSDRTMIDASATGKASIEELRGSSTLLALQWSGKRFRLRAGAGYGNFNIPVVNFIVPVATWFPELDVFWVF